MEIDKLQKPKRIERMRVESFRRVLDAEYSHIRLEKIIREASYFWSFAL